MKKSRRILTYLGGVIVGCVLVYFTLIRGNDRSYWLPKNRVIAELIQSKIGEDALTQCWLNCLKIDVDSLKSLIKEGRVNFSESDVRGGPYPIYRIEVLKGKTTTLLDVGSVDSTLKIINVPNPKISGCDCQ